MKEIKKITVFQLLLTVYLFSVHAQNPKTNSGKIRDNSTTVPSKVPAGSQPSSSSPGNSPSRNQSVQDSTNESKKPGTLIESSGKAINKESNYGLFYLNLILGISRNEFYEVSNGDAGIGVGFGCMYNFLGSDTKDKSPVNIYLGGAFEYFYFGGKSDYVIYDDRNLYYAQDKVTTAVNMNVYSLGLVSRISFFNGLIVPFFEGTAGGRLFSGVNKVTVETQLKSGYSKPNFQSVSTEDRTSLASSLVGTYGYGGGLAIGSTNVRFEMKLMYVYGTTATYVDKASITIDPVSNLVSYQTKTSTTDMLIPQIGLTILF
ncbi:MAG: hypothetical protein ACHQK8_02950 [Bacteroidia bacterium]